MTTALPLAGTVTVQGQHGTGARELWRRQLGGRRPAPG
ncbi:hypothetical protein RKD19_000573 [Streptomyces canus]